MPTDDLAALDATAQAALVAGGELSPLELVDAAIERIERLNGELNAVIHPLFDDARARASAPDLPDGPFRGVPFLVKDLNCEIAGAPYCEGTRFLQRLGWRAPADSFLAANLRRAGLVIAGRTNTPELGIVPTTEPEAFGPSRNPWDPTRSTGGSSGGSAAAVAAGLVPAAHANDGGGSIRIPASECGLVGLKSTRGQVSLGPQHGWSPVTLDVEGAVTRSVRDAAALLDAIAGAMPGDPWPAAPPARPYREEVGANPGRLRIGLLTEVPSAGVTTHADCVAAARDAGALLESLGHTVEPAEIPAVSEPEFVEHFVTLFAAAHASTLEGWSQTIGRPLTPDDVEPLTWALLEHGRATSSATLLVALRWLQRFSVRFQSWWRDGTDLLLTPTIAEPPPKLGEFAAQPDNPLAGLFRAAALVPFTPIANVTGQPAISLPLSWNADGLPIGTQLIAAFGRDDLLVRVAAQLEAARPWSDRRPPVHA